eukprot:1195708-Prorocentrum_minimum.AAC.1
MTVGEYTPHSRYYLTVMLMITVCGHDVAGCYGLNDSANDSGLNDSAERVLAGPHQFQLTAAGGHQRRQWCPLLARALCSRPVTCVAADMGFAMRRGGEMRRVWLMCDGLACCASLGDGTAEMGWTGFEGGRKCL